MSSTIPAELRDGYRSFRTGRYAQEANRFKSLAEGQSPKVMVIGCADSRVDPATIFSAAPGELFVVRNVAALVPPWEEEGAYHGTSAALEFAVRHLKVEHIVVLGHALCGGIKAALAGPEDVSVGRFIGPWVHQLERVRQGLLNKDGGQSPEARQEALEHLSIKYSLENLLRFDFVDGAVNSGKLTLHGAWFSIAEGKLCWLDPESGSFEDVPVPTAT